MTLTINNLYEAHKKLRTTIVTLHPMRPWHRKKLQRKLRQLTLVDGMISDFQRTIKGVEYYEPPSSSTLTP